MGTFETGFDTQSVDDSDILEDDLDLSEDSDDSVDFDSDLEESL